MDFLGQDAFKDRMIGFDRKSGVYQSQPNIKSRYLLLSQNSKPPTGFTLELFDEDATSVVLLKPNDKGDRLEYVSSDHELPEWFDMGVVNVPGSSVPYTKAVEQIARLYAFDTEDVQLVLGQFDIGQFVRTVVPYNYGRIVAVRGPVLRVRYPEPWSGLADTRSSEPGKPVDPTSIWPVAGSDETDFDMTRRLWHEMVQPVSEKVVPKDLHSKLQ